MSTSTCSATLAIAALALAGSLALSQQPPAQPAPSTAPAPAAAPQAPAPAMHHIRPMSQEAARGPMQHGSFQGGPSEHFGSSDHSGMEMGGFHMGPGGMWWKNPHVVERLSLSADQTRQMDDIVEHSRLDLIDLRANLEKQQVMLGPIMDANPVDTAKATAQIDKVADARAGLEKANAKMLLSIRGVLTPDQWTKLHERPTPPIQDAAPTGGPGASAPNMGGSWHGHRPGGSGMDNLVTPMAAQ